MAIYIASSHISPNEWDFIWAFKIICHCLKVAQTIGILFSFYGTKTTTKGGWVTMGSLPRRFLFSSYSNH